MVLEDVIALQSNLAVAGSLAGVIAILLVEESIVIFVIDAALGSAFLCDPGRQSSLLRLGGRHSRMNLATGSLLLGRFLVVPIKLALL